VRGERMSDRLGCDGPALVIRGLGRGDLIPGFARGRPEGAVPDRNGIANPPKPRPRR
jgi:hypothetical protein